MIHEDSIDLCGGDLLPPLVDNLLFPAGDEEIALIIQISQVTCPEPAIDEYGLFLFWSALVSVEQKAVFYCNLTDGIRSKGYPVFIDDCKGV